MPLSRAKSAASSIVSSNTVPSISRTMALSILLSWMLIICRAIAEEALRIEPAAIEALIALGDLYKLQGDLHQAEEYFVRAAQTMPGVPTGYLRMATIAREAENRDAVVYWNDLARQAEPGGLLRPTD